MKVNDQSMTSIEIYISSRVWKYDLIKTCFVTTSLFIPAVPFMNKMSVTLSVAHLSDHEEILSLTSKDKEFYGGMDYLPHALYNWLVEGSDPGSRRKNLIFLLDQKIIGFMSIYFQKKWTSCVKFAFRISRYCNNCNVK